ncbi:MAG: Gfo/Idh/MocA family oxidoreductase [Actinomycetota bacterium]|nr:Gfo/Idh/MocA family oxidoreductase [Actinomycetota bacterium]
MVAHLGDTGATRWGFLGAGFIASRALAPAVHAADGAVLQAVAARDPQRAAALEPRTVHPTYQALVEDPDVDAVYISLTNEQHLPWTLAALAAGKHVLCEKPLGLDGSEVRRMLDASAAAGRLLVEAGWYRWHPRTRRAEALVSGGASGQVTELEAAFRFGGVPAGNYRLDPSRGGGAWLDVGWYVCNAVAWAVPIPEGWAAGSAVRRAPGGVDLSVATELDHQSGVRTHLGAGIDDPEDQSLTITLSGGSVHLPRPDPFTSWHRPSSLTWVDAEGPHREDFPAVDPYRLMVEQVGRRARGHDDAWLMPADESVRTVDLMDVVRASMG